ncbi:hypothetical protein OSB04_016739 [Centaurea solstitialis]|uniref:Copia protein n=1 Tax=Centaurea solstitialis TaxID=347529 RepID=A0AA38WK14_9ASTR|nr:hypothetical protein OSB04_016739 [Centaurea solstitialis]
MIGSQLYLTLSGPDIKYSTCLCARYQFAPKESHLTDVKQIFKYLKGTPNLGCKLDRMSTTGSCQLLGGKLVSWTSKKQNSMSTSTTEIEYVAAGSYCPRVLWMRNQLLDYDLKLSKIPIFCDNTSVIAIANNPMLHSKTKLIEIRYHFIRDHVMNGDIELDFVPTDYQLTDIFTKPFDETRFNTLISELGSVIHLHGPRQQYDYIHGFIPSPENPKVLTSFTFNLSNFKAVLKFPGYPTGATAYEPMPSNDVLIEFLDEIHY